MKITVIGAGSWGTALALHFSQHGNRVSLWTRNADQVRQMKEERENKHGLPGFPFPETLEVCTDLEDALQDSGLLTFQVLKEVLPDNKKIGVLSGPSFAQELAKQLPCAVVLASENQEWVEELVPQLNTSVMRLYGSTDVIGVAVGGAVKNVMAIATGLSDGLEYGLNARAALVTRGLAEITRLASAMGAQPKTMMGLAGIGDLILTCTGALSRNRRVGLGLAEGKELHQVLVEIGHVSEGVSTIEEVFNTACKYQIDMPITQTLLQLIRKEMTPQQVVERLMERSARFE